MMSTSFLRWKVDILSHVAGPLLGVFLLVWQGVDKLSQLLRFTALDDETDVNETESVEAMKIFAKSTILVSKMYMYVYVYMYIRVQ